MAGDNDEGDPENEDPHEDGQNKRTGPLQRIGLLGKTALVWVKLVAQLTKLFS